MTNKVFSSRPRITCGETNINFHLFIQVCFFGPYMILFFVFTHHCMHHSLFPFLARETDIHSFQKSVNNSFACGMAGLVLAIFHKLETAEKIHLKVQDFLRSQDRVSNNIFTFLTLHFHSLDLALAEGRVSI